MEGDKETMKTAIYCRVSTDTQEREGTSLQTQLEACREYCQGKGYDVSYRFSEAYSGLSLERPELDKLRELVRAEAIDVLVCYSLDRLTRDPGHGVIITQELEKHHVILEAVTEDVDNSELGKLISYIRGYASKLEAEKIRERSIRGRKACAREGRMTGGFHTTYGYDYVRTIRGERQARRVINETEASWVRHMYSWLVTDGLSTGAIRDKLVALNAPTKHGGRWKKASVLSVLRNPSYCGKTYAFTSLKRKPRRKPQNEWIEIASDVTPAIITAEVYEAAQKQLQVNRAKALRNTRREYLLRGHLRCRHCGRAYVGGITPTGRKTGDRYRRIYRCLGKWKDNWKDFSPDNRCQGKIWRADDLEAMVWGKLTAYLSDRDLIIAELEKEKQTVDQAGALETELKQIERQLRAVDRDQHQLLQWALKGFPADQVEAENRKYNKARETLMARKTELETQIRASLDAAVNVPNLERFIEDMQKRLPELDFEGKRLALDMLGITVWLDKDNIEITGMIDVEASVTATTHYWTRRPTWRQSLAGRSRLPPVCP